MQRILVDGMAHLEYSFTRLFDLIHTHSEIPELLKIMRTIPVFKNKGSKNEIVKYRPITNL
jgi:hypothetical protein